MSIGGIGSYGAGNISQLLASLLSKLDTSSDTSSDDSSTTSQTVASPLTGSAKPKLSSMILGALIGMQQQSQTTSTTSTTQSDPVQSLFNAIDSDSDGSVTQSELESYVEQLGGTADEADSLFSMLDQSGTGSLSESDLAAQAPPPPPQGAGGPSGAGGPGGAGGPPPSGNGSDATSAIASQLADLMDTNNDNSVSESEFETFVTDHGGTADQASTDFSALDANQSGTVDSSEFESALKSLQQKMTDNPYLSVLSLLSTFAGSSVSISA